MTTTSSLRPLSPQEWETLIDDYNQGVPSRLHRWTSADYGGPALVDLALSTILRKDFSHQLKLHLLVFLEEHSVSLFTSPQSSLPRLLETLRHVIQSPTPSDVAASASFSLKEQFLISATSVFIAISASNFQYLDTLEGLVELLLTIINRPNHGVDRQTRAIACECLRELEMSFPCLLSEIGAHIWGLCQSERTHAAQSYVLLLAALSYNIVSRRIPNGTILNASTPLVPFNVPRILVDGNGFDEEKTGGTSLPDMASYKELRRVISFLLEWPQYLTPGGVLEFMRMTIPMAKALELQASLLKVQFSGLIYTYDPLLCHAFLGMFLEFSDSFDGKEDLDIIDRLVLQSKECSQNNVFRLLIVHWLLGLFRLVVNRDVSQKRNVVDRSLSFYPAIFDSLALKSLKLDLAAYCSVLLDDMRPQSKHGNGSLTVEATAATLLKDCLICVSSFKWLPPWSTETLVAFRTIHKFMVGASSHSGSNHSDSSSHSLFIQSSVFHTLQNMLVESTLNYAGLVPVIVCFVDRLLGCYKHCGLGEWLLETWNESFLPKLKIDYKLGCHFPILERIAENPKVSPSGLIELLAKFMDFLIEKHGSETSLKSWSLGSKVLGICRTMLIHHHSSSLFLGLSHLLAFTCLSFPDLEVRDHARTYLRMLLCIPGRKLRDLLNIGEQLPGISPSTHSSSFLNLQSPIYHDLEKSQSISTYIHLERRVPLLVKQSWSLALPNLSFVSEDPFPESNGDPKTSEQNGLDSTTNGTFSDMRTSGHQEPLRVMDTKDSKIVEILRRHFSVIPDFRFSTGIKIGIPCTLKFDSELFSQSANTNICSEFLNEIDSLPAMYATVLKFSSSAPYGTIPSYHVPFLLGQPSRKDCSFNKTNALQIVPVGHVSMEKEEEELQIVPVGNISMDKEEQEEEEEERFQAHVMIELEPRVPQPGVVDVHFQANADNGQIVEGQLHGINVGIEDMFLKAIVPEDIPEDAVPNYNLDLFNALWEACGTSSSTGRETFVLKNGKGVAAISGTQSVKLLEVPFMALIQAVERCLAPFVVSVIGESLTRIVRSGEMIKDVVWKEFDSDATSELSHSSSRIDQGPLRIRYLGNEHETENEEEIQPVRKDMGTFLILIFLPPRFHLLFKMEVSGISTLARVRTDHWPCLAYVDELLEALFYMNEEVFC